MRLCFIEQFDNEIDLYPVRINNFVKEKFLSIHFVCDVQSRIGTENQDSGPASFWTFFHPFKTISEK